MNNPSFADVSPWQRNGISGIDASSIPLRVTFLRKVVLWATGAYIILNSGFMMVRIPPVGVGIPIGEVVLIGCLCVISLPVLLPKMGKEAWLFPILLWWGMSLSRCLIDTTVGGAWSFRDASQAIESLYLIVGFWLANSVENLSYFFRWLRKILLVAIAYGLLLPANHYLQSFSPRLPGVAGVGAPLIFSVTNTAVILIWAACWLLIDGKQKDKLTKGRILLACLLVTFSVAFAQQRTIYLAVLMTGAILFLTKRRLATKWATILLFGVVAIGAISVSGINVEGGRGHKISLDFISQHFQSITGSSGSGDVEGSAAGVSLRLGWWRRIYQQMQGSHRVMIFGLGYGVSLTDFHGALGASAREPHNSYISVLARLGISGMLVWVAMQASLYLSWWRSFQLCRRMRWVRDQDNLLLLLIYSVQVLAYAIGEDGFEKPFLAIPYYLFFGVVLRYGRYLRLTAAQQGQSAI